MLSGKARCLHKVVHRVVLEIAVCFLHSSATESFVTLTTVLYCKTLCTGHISPSSLWLENEWQTSSLKVECEIREVCLAFYQVQ